MSTLESIYCYMYQYEADSRQGYDPRKMGTILTAVVLLMWVAAAFFILLPFGLGDALIDVLQDIFGYSSGKTIGRVGAAAIFFLIYPFVLLTLGSKKRYDKTIERYLSIEEGEPRSLQAAKGLSTVIISSVVFVVAIVIGSIAATFL